jgi:uncharacterized protein YbjT (DUF2867 family)
VRILVSGGTGLLGQGFLSVVEESEGHEVRCLVRKTSPVGRLGDLELAYGDARDAGSIAKALRGTDACVHIAGIEYAPQVLEAMRRTGMNRLVVVSSTSAHSAYEPRSGPKRRMERLVRKSGLEWTITRPSMIYGSELDKNVSKLLRFLDRSPVFPIFGTGENLWQPVYYEDLARGVFAALESPAAVGRSYDLPGGRSLSYVELVRTAADALGKKVRVVRIPLEPARRALELAERLGLSLPVRPEQVLRLREDKAYPYDEARRELGYAPRSFPEGVALEVARLRELGVLGA